MKLLTIESPLIISQNDTAEAGNFLFGGLLNRCRMSALSEGESFGIFNLRLAWWMRGISVLKSAMMLSINSESEIKEMITSDSYELCFCRHVKSLLIV